MPLSNEFPTPAQPPKPPKPPVYGPVMPPKPPVYGPVAPQPPKPTVSTSSNNTQDYVRGAGASSGVTPPVKPIIGPIAYPGPRPPKAPQPAASVSSGNRDDFVGQKDATKHVAAQAQALTQQKEERERRLRVLAQQAEQREKELTDRQQQTILASAGQSGTGDGGAGGGILPIDHSGNKSSNGGSKSSGGEFSVGGPRGNGVKSGGGVSQLGSDGGKKNNDFGGSTAVVTGSNSSIGLSDLQKLRKFSFQAEKAEDRLSTLAGKENQIMQQIAGATDPSQKMQLAKQLGSVQEQQQTVKARLERKEVRLNNVQNRMASAGNGNGQSQGVKAVVVAQGNNSNGGKKDNDFGGSTAVVVGPNGTGGLSDIQKVRKFSFQIEQAEGKLSKLGAQESQIRAAMGATSDPAEQQQLAMQLGSVQQQQQRANERLVNKSQKLSKVENRMASAGTSDQLSQGVKAVAIGQQDKNNGNGPKNGGGQGNNQAQGGIGTKLVNVGGPDSGRPQAGDLKPLPSKNDGPKLGGGGNTLAGVGGPDAGRPQMVAAAGQFDQGGVRPPINMGNGNGNGGGNALAGVGGPDAGRPQAVALGNGGGNGNGNQGNGNGNGGGDGNRAGQGGGGNGGGGNNGHAFGLSGGIGNGQGNGGGNGNGNDGGKKDNDGPKMGGPVGGGNNNDSLPTNPPKLVSLGGGGGGTGGGGAGKFGKKR